MTSQRQEQFDKIIRSLKDEYRLNLYPSSTAGNDAKLCKIYTKLDILFCESPRRLNQALGHFRAEAARPLPPDTTTREAGAFFGDLLLASLNSAGRQQSQTKSGKRIHEYFASDPTVKRTKPSTINVNHEESVDAIPVRSKKPRPLSHVAPHNPNISYLRSNASITSQSFASTRTSHSSRVFSDVANSFADTQTTVQAESGDETPKPAGDLYPLSPQEEEALRESFTGFESGQDDESAGSTPGGARVANNVDEGLEQILDIDVDWIPPPDFIPPTNELKVVNKSSELAESLTKIWRMFVCSI